MNIVEGLIDIGRAAWETLHAIYHGFGLWNFDSLGLGHSVGTLIEVTLVALAFIILLVLIVYTIFTSLPGHRPHYVRRHLSDNR